MEMNSTDDEKMTIKIEEEESDTSQDYLAKDFTIIEDENDIGQSISMKIEFDESNFDSNDSNGCFGGVRYPNRSKRNVKFKEENVIQSDEDLDPIAFIDVSLGGCEEDLILHFDEEGTKELNPVETEKIGSNSSRNKRKNKLIAREEFAVSKKKTKEFVCKFCNVPFKLKRELDKHIKSHVGKTPYECTGCGARFRVRKLLKKHKCIDKNEDSRDFQCNDCGKYFVTKRSLRTHVLTHSSDRPHVCSLCGKSYKFAYPLTLHMKKKHLGTARVYSCDLCDYTTPHRAAIDSHLTRHTQDYKYRCEICNKGFMAHSWLVEHKNFHTGEKPFECDVCHKRFFYTRYLNAHKKQYHPPPGETIKVHACETCGKIFAHRKSLRMHVKSHTGENVYLCDICGKALSSSEHLKFHRRIHTGEKPHVCKYCGKGFSKSCNLTQHERVHTGDRPYKCQVCGKGFSQRSTLVIHSRYHTGQRPYICHICGKSFVCQALLTVHIKKSGCDPKDIEQYCRDSDSDLLAAALSSTTSSTLSCHSQDT